MDQIRQPMKVEKLGLLDADTLMEEEEKAPKAWHEHLVKGMITGVGFLSDAYDLFIINIVILIIAEYDPEVESYKSGIATAVLVGAIIGQLSFGIVADKIGRRLGFILTLMLVITGSIASSLSFSLGKMNVYICLIIWRFILGIGVGGEYPLSATISAETSSTKKRGKNTALVFSMQGVGNLLGTLMGFFFYSVLPDRLDIVWRLALGFGAVPGLLMIYFRVRMEETSRFAAAQQPGGDLPTSTSPLSRSSGAYDDMNITSMRGFSARLRMRVQAFWTSEQMRLIRKNWRRLTGTAGSWFLLDVTFYANALFSTTVLRLAGVQDNLRDVLIWTIYLALAALPGYWVAVFLIERIGRRTLQLGGFLVLGGVYLVMGLAYSQIESNSGLFFFMYSLTFFVTNAGPNTTTYVLPSESFPTEIRATCHGFSAACGKAGAAVGSAMMPALLDRYSLDVVLVICAVVALLGAVHTFFFTIETLGKSLEQINEDNENSENKPIE